MHRNSLLLYEKHLLPRIADGDRVLELGCTARADQYFRSAQRAGRTVEWCAADLEDVTLPEGVLRVSMPDDYSIGFPSGRFDVVLSGQVIEHVRRPWLWVPELARVCRPGGLVMLVSPISWDLHRHPVDCWRIWPDGMRELLAVAGLSAELVLAERLDSDTPREQKCQINPGPVLDLVTIGKKPE